MSNRITKILSTVFLSGTVIAIMATASLAYGDNAAVSIDDSTEIKIDLMNNSNWVNIGGGEWVYVDSKGKLAEGWKKIGKKWYFFEAHSGVMVTGWTDIGNKWYYFDKSGVLQTNKWVKNYGEWAYVNGNGNPVTGWKKIGKKWYYFDEVYYTMYTLWNEIDGTWYYFDKNGVMVSNGWAPSYVDEDDDGETDYTDWYYMDSSGKPTKGWKQLSKKWYYFDKTYGWMYKGWREISGKWYFFDRSSGAMKSSCFVQGDTDWYYLNSSGNPVTGWQKVSNKWYYFDTGFRMLTGWQEIEGKTYYFYDSGAMAVNTTIDGVKINSSGEAVSEMSIKSLVDSFFFRPNSQLSITDGDDYEELNATGATATLFFKKAPNDYVYYTVEQNFEQIYKSSKIKVSEVILEITLDKSISGLYDGDFIKQGWLQVSVYDKNSELLAEKEVYIYNDARITVDDSFPWWCVDSFEWYDYDDTMEENGIYNYATETLAFSVKLRQDDDPKYLYYAYYKLNAAGKPDYNNPLCVEYITTTTYNSGEYYDFDYHDDYLEAGDYLLVVAPTKKGLASNPYFTAKCTVLD